MLIFQVIRRTARPIFEKFPAYTFILPPCSNWLVLRHPLVPLDPKTNPVYQVHGRPPKMSHEPMNHFNHTMVTSRSSLGRDANARSARRASWLGWFADGLLDLRSGLKYWRLSHLIGLGEIRRRYARSRIGQFWLTLSTAITVVALGVVWSTLWKVELHDLMPFFAISLILWNLITGVLAEASTIFVATGPMFLNQGMSFSTAIYGLIYKHVLIFLHNIPVIALIMAAFTVPLRSINLLAAPGLLCLLLSLLWLGYVIAIACVRYRDITQAVQSFLLIAFLITPVLWTPDQLGADKDLLALNPLADLLAVVREPLLGHAPSPSEWIGAVAFSLGGFLIALPLIGFCRRRIIYWI
jgi:ABC-type polysaccharide/polyol phosphate export permease